MLRDIIFILKEMAKGLIHIAPYAAIALPFALIVTSRVMTDLKKEQKNRSKSGATDKDPNRYIA